jgi:hypothetical protein
MLTSGRLLSEPTVQPHQRESAAQEASMLDVLGESSAPGAAVEPPTQSHVPGQQQQEEQQQQEGQQQQAPWQPAVPVGYNEGVDILRQQEFCRLAGRVYAGGWVQASQDVGLPLAWLIRGVLLSPSLLACGDLLPSCHIECPVASCLPACLPTCLPADYAGTAPFSEVMLAEVFQGLR